jgi:hypothetical protein
MAESSTRALRRRLRERALVVDKRSNDIRLREHPNEHTGRDGAVEDVVRGNGKCLGSNNNAVASSDLGHQVVSHPSTVTAVSRR